jgi:hypothetical protein
MGMQRRKSVKDDGKDAGDKTGVSAGITAEEAVSRTLSFIS